ncbi:hypothetical protein B0T26DRAFT_704380, partial [Lasiosphaeria miniovina]
MRLSFGSAIVRRCRHTAVLVSFFVSLFFFSLLYGTQGEMVRPRNAVQQGQTPLASDSLRRTYTAWPRFLTALIRTGWLVTAFSEDPRLSNLTAKIITIIVI